ncbi:MAG: hypothetical protein IPP90_23485 [Gemmatimonadaceae bacterium]|nr:hypothetical protein [Gemmatimonadaceae bacterium]
MTRDFSTEPLDLGPAGASFDPPATLSIKYDAAALPSGEYPRLHKVVNGAWVPIPGSTHDQINHVVSAPITGFSTWGVLGTGLDLTVHVSGGVGEVRVESDVPPDPCTYQESPCTRNETAGTALELVASPLTPDARFEEWTGTGTGFSCTTNPRCQLVMDQDREVTARFSMPGTVTLDRSTAAFSMTRGGALPAAQTATITNTGGRALTLAPVSVTYAPLVTGWLDVQVDRTTIDPRGSQVRSPWR